MSQPANPWRCFATTVPGLEPLLVRELNSLPGIRRIQKGGAGCNFEARGAEAFWRACASLRTAHRVVRNLGPVDARSKRSLYDSVRRLIRWPELIPPEKTFAIWATASDSIFRDQRLASLVTKDAIVDAVRDALGARPSVDTVDPDVVLRVNIRKDRGILSLDGAGRTALHARGYRVESGHAPLRETLAAATVLASGWDGSPEAGPLVDPMAGSGTLLIEGALIGQHMVPGVFRDEPYGFSRWPGFDAVAYDRVLASMEADVRHDVRATPRLFGGDRDGQRLAIARANADRADVSHHIALSRRDVAELTPPHGMGPGTVVTNPPYGRRLAEQESALQLMRTLGEQLRREFQGWCVAMIAPPKLIDAVGLKVERSLRTKNGPIDVSIACLSIN